MRSRHALLLFVLLSLAACEKPESGHWLGYIEGEPALIAPPQAGWITSLDVARGTQVKAGDSLFTLDATREIAARDNAVAAITATKEQAQQAESQFSKAQASAAEIEADIMRAQKELARQGARFR